MCLTDCYVILNADFTVIIPLLNFVFCPILLFPVLRFTVSVQFIL